LPIKIGVARKGLTACKINGRSKKMSSCSTA